MELIFFYLNQSYSYFIEKTGFNFSSKFYFSVEIEDENYILRQSQHKTSLPNNFFDNSGCIINISAIVGENGSGKTTLLNNLARYSGMIKDTQHRVEYDSYFQNPSPNDKIITIYQTNDKLVCYHNINNLKNETPLETIRLETFQPSIKDIQKNDYNFDDKNKINISKICLTNSMDSTWNALSLHRGLSEIHLNTNSLHTIKKEFYKYNCKKVDSCAGGYYQYQDLLCDYRSTTDFQHILDILYLNYIESENVNSIFAQHIEKNITIGFQSYEECLENTFGIVNLGKPSKDISLGVPFRVLNKALHRFDKSLYKEDIFCILYVNLLFELITYSMYSNHTDFVNKGEILGKVDLIDCINNLIQKLIKTKDSYGNFFKESMEEIIEYEKCLSSCEITSFFSRTINDKQYVYHKKIISQDKKNIDIYDSFLNLITKSVFRRKYSFVLKYIVINGLQLASGERALLNFFSWLHTISFFDQLIGYNTDRLRDTLLILIDEIDLYCHPMWQQKILYYLIEEIKAQFSNKKVQIIFTTHSPIVLSDIPRSNVIYLRKSQGKCMVDDSFQHMETFGANIYQLFDDAFFLGERGQIGEFSKQKIRSIIDKVKPKPNSTSKAKYPRLKPNEIECLENEISQIGEKLIRNKLYDMLNKCKYQNLSMNEKKIKMYEEKIKRLQSGEEL